MMKKVLSILLIIMLLAAMSGCKKAAEEAAVEEPEETALVSEPVEESSFRLHVQITDEEEAPIAADCVKITTKGGQLFEAEVSGGVFTIENLPYEQGMQGVLYAENQYLAGFGLSIWTGYALGYHNNLSKVSIDIPGNTGELYMKLTVCSDVEKVYCTYVSQYSFDAEDQKLEGEGMQIDEETAVAAGLYGVKYAAATGLNLRAEASSESKSLMQLNFGDQLTLMNGGEDVSGTTWYKVQVDSEHEGYVSGDYLGKRYTINKNGVNVRKAPNTDGEVLNMIGAGTVVIALDEGTKDGDYKWFHIKTRSGLDGYVRNDFMTMS